MHAVLLVATENGEVVLDNLSPWVLPWAEAPYAWLDRQAAGTGKWVRVAA
jgi:predicted transglutaminase-like cysteine proteinase